MGCVNIVAEKISDFQTFILSWWITNRRDLPWRKTHDPYKILVSEMMLQQTQVSRVLPKYREFLENFPDIFRLAAATPAHVLTVWKGMGYNRRALYLKKTAEAIVSQHNGVFPKDEQELLQLPGLGKYTARAILVFAFKQNVGAVDTNIRKIIQHFFFEDIPQTEKVIDNMAQTLVPQGKSWEWHQALMDFGALELSKIVKPTNEKLKKKSIPFRETNRFFRGRIVDQLREGAITEVALIDDFVRRYDQTEAFLESILTGLIKEGLIIRAKGRLSLPI